ncbi:MAG TPA: hypothetical protein VF041_19140 [Gemmatimonadaceae bacterium]
MTTRTLPVSARRPGAPRRPGRRGLLVWQLALILLVIAAILAAVFILRSRHARAGANAANAANAAPTTTASAAGTVTMAGDGGLPLMPVKPTPKEITFDGCPPVGDGGDAELNRLKNRVDEGNWVPVRFDDIAKLPWPRSVERAPRRRWSAADRRAVGRFEGIPVSVEGFVAGAKVEGPETPNCHGAASKYRDWHVWLAPAPGKDRRGSIVVETTPRVRTQHPEWRISALRVAAKRGERVRISGWLMLDPEHPDQVGRTRGTIWEIHPILRIDVRRGSAWVPLDGARAR